MGYALDRFKQKAFLSKHACLFLITLVIDCWHGIKVEFFSLQTYGYEHILTLNNLEKAGLLKSQTGGRNNYPTIRKTLRLWMDDVNEQVNVHFSSEW